MAIREEDIVQINPPPMNTAEAIYLPAIFKGFGTTLRHFFTSFGQSKVFTINKTTRAMQYPEERRENIPVLEGGMEPSNFRGVHRLNRDVQVEVLSDGEIRPGARITAQSARILYYPHPERDLRIRLTRSRQSESEYVCLQLTKWIE